jgi:hypothetical protein
MPWKEVTRTHQLLMRVAPSFEPSSRSVNLPIFLSHKSEGHPVVIENFKELTTKVPMMGEMKFHTMTLVYWVVSTFKRECVCNSLSPNTYNQIKGTQNNQRNAYTSVTYII